MQLKYLNDIEDRIRAAVGFLKDGQSFRVGPLKLGIENTRTMYVIGWTQYKALENLTKTSALKELQGIRDLFQEMTTVSPELREFIQDKTIEYNLAFDYGQGAIGICSEKDKKLTWEVELK